MARSGWIGVLVAQAAVAVAIAMPPAAPANAPANPTDEPTGTLAIRAVQGTQGGLSMAGETVHVHLFHNKQLFHTIDTQLDDTGLAMVGDLPVGVGFQPVVQIEHAGVTYQETGSPMDPATPNASVEIVVYDVTETKPAWRVGMRQVMAAEAQDAVRVSESLTVENPADATWLGDTMATTGKKTTVHVVLPPGARDVHLDHGFHGWCCTTFEGGELAVQMPLMPGRTNYQYSYFVPVEGGRANIAFASPAPTERVTVFVPADGSAGATPEGLDDLGIQGSSAGPVRMYQAQGLTGGQQVGIVLAGFATPASTPALPTPAGSSQGSLWVWIGIGGGLVIIILAAFVLVRRPSPAG